MPPGFSEDDLVAAVACFKVTAAAIVAQAASLRPARPTMPGLTEACVAALALPRMPSQDEARRFFETHFRPEPIEPGGDAFFTGYYEPVVEGALAPDETFTTPLLGRPADLVTFAADDPRPGWAADLSAARRLPSGDLAPFPTRRAIEADIGGYRPVVWLRDAVECFLIHVQGSARIRLPDDGMLRLTYAGRNGHPYTSIGRLLIDGRTIALADMSLARLKAWIRAAGQAPGEPGRLLMQRNASFIFFEAAPVSDEEGPTGGAGVPLTALRSIAVDRSLWCYGLPFWVEATLPWEAATATPFRRLMIAQDIGSAIIGPARADLFFGSGEEAGRRAGDIRHHGRFTLLRPRPRGAGA
jgi:membrane-bound lytic murein transglycosylase A